MITLTQLSEITIIAFGFAYIMLGINNFLRDKLVEMKTKELKKIEFIQSQQRMYNNEGVQQPREQMKIVKKNTTKIYSIDDIKPLINNDNLSCNERIQQLKVMLK